MIMPDSAKQRLVGKRAIVTGAGRGIGRCAALLFARQGAKVVVSDIGTDRQGAGVIVNPGSEAGLGMIFNSAYAAAKEGIAGLTRSVAREQGRFRIRCNMIRPRATINTGGGEWGAQVFQKWAPMVKAMGRY